MIEKWIFSGRERDLATAFSLQEGNVCNVTFLTNHVENKVLDNGDSFTGEVDAVTGDLVNGVRTSQDALSTYEGSFLTSMKHGEGTLRDGSSKFVGVFHQDQLQHGTLITKRFTYSGSFKGGDIENPVFHGKGFLAYSDKTVYKGDFEDGSYEGFGILTNANRDCYDGKFSNGRKNGNGTMQYADGRAGGKGLGDLAIEAGTLSSKENGNMISCKARVSVQLTLPPLTQACTREISSLEEDMDVAC